MEKLNVLTKFSKLPANDNVEEEILIEIRQPKLKKILNCEIYFLIDISSSTLRKNLFKNIKGSLKYFVKKYWEFLNIGIVTFAENATLYVEPKNNKSSQDILDRINILQPSGRGTDLLGALKLLTKITMSNDKKCIVVITDGEPTTSSDNKVVSFLQNNLSEIGQFLFIAFLPDVDEPLYKNAAKTVNGNYFIFDRENSGTDKMQNEIEDLIVHVLTKRAINNVLKIDIAQYGVSKAEVSNILVSNNYLEGGSLLMLYKLHLSPHIIGRFKIADITLRKCEDNCSTPLIIDFLDSTREIKPNEEFISKIENKGSVKHRSTRKITEEELKRLRELSKNKFSGGS